MQTDSIIFVISSRIKYLVHCTSNRRDKLIVNILRVILYRIYIGSVTYACKRISNLTFNMYYVTYASYFYTTNVQFVFALLRSSEEI